MSCRRFAIADIHGCNLTLKALLHRLEFRPKDTLFILGDCIDRGADSKGVLDTLMHLLQCGYDVRVLRGNHEDMLLRTVTGHHDHYSHSWESWWGEKTLSSFGVTAPSEIPEDYLAFLSRMPFYAETDGFVLVHGSLMPGDNRTTETSHQEMLWGDAWHGRDGLPCGSRLVSGHRVVTLSTMMETLTTRHLLIDNGCCGGCRPGMGNLVALNLETLEVTAQPLIDTVICD